MVPHTHPPTYLQHSMGRHFLSKSQSLPPRLSWIGIRIQPCPTISCKDVSLIQKNISQPYPATISVHSEEDKVKLTSHNWPSWSKAASPSSVLFAKCSSSSSDGGSCISTESSAKEHDQSKTKQKVILIGFILVCDSTMWVRGLLP